MSSPFISARTQKIALPNQQIMDTVCTAVTVVSGELFRFTSSEKYPNLVQLASWNFSVVIEIGQVFYPYRCRSKLYDDLQSCRPALD